MFIEYFYWHYVLAPAWLVKTGWYMQRALLQFFSVPYMVRTLFAHWHKDAVAYRAGGIGNILLTFAWNQISRGIGAVIRSAVLALWIVTNTAYIVLATLLLLVFLAWPLLVLIGISAGIALLAA